MKSLFHFNYFYLVPIIIFSFSLNIQAQDISVGIVEFEEKNNIGLEKAGRIIAEWVVTEMKSIGKFQIQERLLLNKVLEEQNLMLSGVIDGGQVVEIGKLYGVNALVTGSIMKVGETISVTGRIINLESGEVLKTFYDKASQIYPETFATYSFETYLYFLLAHELILKQNGIYVISDIGVSFLQYLVERGIPEKHL